MLQLRRRYLHAGKRAPTFRQIVIARQGIKREGVSIQMVFKIKDAWESGAGKFGLVPGTVGILLLQEPGDGALNGRIIRAHCREEADQTPSRLRCSALTFAFQCRIVIGENRLTETAIAILNGAQPIGSTMAIRLIGHPDLFERPQDSASSINVIYAPAPEPGTIRSLFMPDKGACSLNHRMIGRPTHLSKTFDRAGGDVRSGRAQHRIVVSKRNVIQK